MTGTDGPLFNTSPEVGTKPTMGRGGWCVIGAVCTILVAIYLRNASVQTPIPGHEGSHTLIVILFTAFSAGAILGFSRCLPAGWTVVIFAVAAIISILGLLGSPPQAIKFMFPWGWSTLLVFSVLTVLERARAQLR